MFADHAGRGGGRHRAVGRPDRQQQHADHRGGDGSGPRRAAGRLGGVLLRPLLRRRDRPLRRPQAVRAAARRPRARSVLVRRGDGGRLRAGRSLAASAPAWSPSARCLRPTTRPRPGRPTRPRRSWSATFDGQDPQARRRGRRRWLPARASWPRAPHVVGSCWRDRWIPTRCAHSGGETEGGSADAPLLAGGSARRRTRCLPGRPRVTPARAVVTAVVGDDRRARGEGRGHGLVPGRRLGLEVEVEPVLRRTFPPARG